MRIQYEYLSYDMVQTKCNLKPMISIMYMLNDEVCYVNHLLDSTAECIEFANSVHGQNGKLIGECELTNDGCFEFITEWYKYE